MGLSWVDTPILEEFAVRLYAIPLGRLGESLRSAEAGTH